MLSIQTIAIGIEWNGIEIESVPLAKVLAWHLSLSTVSSIRPPATACETGARERRQSHAQNRAAAWDCVQ